MKFCCRDFPFLLHVVNSLSDKKDISLRESFSETGSYTLVKVVWNLIYRPRWPLISGDLRA